MHRFSLPLILATMLTSCGFSHNEPAKCVAPFANASISYTFCTAGATSGQALCQWDGGNPPYPKAFAKACQATPEIECVEECPPAPACVPDGLASGDTFEVTSCGDGKTAACRLVEEPGGVTVPAWGCTYGGLTCVQGCENGASAPSDQPSLTPCLYELTSRYPDHDQACKLLLSPDSKACAVELSFPDETLDHPAGVGLYNGCVHADGVCVPSCIGPTGI